MQSTTKLAMRTLRLRVASPCTLRRHFTWGGSMTKTVGRSPNATKHTTWLWTSCSVAIGSVIYYSYLKETYSTSMVECEPFPSPSFQIPCPEEIMKTYGWEHKGNESFKNSIIMNPKAPMAERMAAYVQELQAEIVAALEEVEKEACSTPSPNQYAPFPKKFLKDAWDRPEKGTGGGISCVLQDGRVFERAGVMTTVMHGELTPAAAAAMRARKPDAGQFPTTQGPIPFYAAGISIVIHPHHPFAPTAHMNYRYFEVRDPITKKAVAWWFGGGADLTPSYLDEKDAIHFHQQLKAPCDRHLGPQGYPSLKKWCDEYFYLPHRKETRGVGGLFFDDLDLVSIHTPDRIKKLSPQDGQQALFAFVRDAGRAFIPAYIPLVQRHLSEPYSIIHKDWQQIRRGRYVEFNLVLDRGTKFGLATPNARTESILVSLPRTAKWDYYNIPAAGSPEAQLLEVLKNPRDWL